MSLRNAYHLHILDWKLSTLFMQPASRRHNHLFCFQTLRRRSRARWSPNSGVPPVLPPSDCSWRVQPRALFVQSWKSLTAETQTEAQEAQAETKWRQKREARAAWAAWAATWAWMMNLGWKGLWNSWCRAAVVLYLGLSDLRTTFAAIRRDGFSWFPNTVVTTLNGHPTTSIGRRWDDQYRGSHGWRGAGRMFLYVSYRSSQLSIVHLNFPSYLALLFFDPRGG